MGLCRVHITKEIILSELESKSIPSKQIERNFKIDSLLNQSNATTLDRWSSNFFRLLNPEEREIRKILKNKYMFSSSGLDHQSDPLFFKLKSMSEALISLYIDPSFYDLDIVKCLVPSEFPANKNEYGNLYELVHQAKLALIKLIGEA